MHSHIELLDDNHLNITRPGADHSPADIKSVPAVAVTSYQNGQISLQQGNHYISLSPKFQEALLEVLHCQLDTSSKYGRGILNALADTVDIPYIGKVMLVDTGGPCKPHRKRCLILANSIQYGQWDIRTPDWSPFDQPCAISLFTVGQDSLFPLVEPIPTSQYVPYTVADVLPEWFDREIKYRFATTIAVVDAITKEGIQLLGSVQPWDWLVTHAVWGDSGEPVGKMVE